MNMLHCYGDSNSRGADRLTRIVSRTSAHFRSPTRRCEDKHQRRQEYWGHRPRSSALEGPCRRTRSYKWLQCQRKTLAAAGGSPSGFTSWKPPWEGDTLTVVTRNPPVALQMRSRSSQVTL